MAELFLARTLREGATKGRHVVLKRIARERAADTQFVQMFLDEARLAAQLRHPNIAQVFDIGRLGASYYFTMEYVHGVTVEDLIEKADEHHTQLPVDAVLSILFGTAAGLSHAHERTGNNGKPLDIVHRDISPSNLMVSYDGHVKVVDFGVAKAQMVGRPETQAGEIKGKVGYLSPEQCRLQKLDARSDLYSLGVVAWEMLTGKRLWKRESPFSTMAAIATEEVPLASEYREDLPHEVDRLVSKLLATEVQERLQSARDVLQAIELVSTTTRSNTSPSQLSKLMREMFGAPVEPWMAHHETINVTATPIPGDLETHDEDPSVDTVEHKLTTVFSVASFGDTDVSTRTKLPNLDRFSTTGEASFDRPVSHTDATREIASLGRAPSVPPRRPATRASTELIPENHPGTEILEPDPVFRGSTRHMPELPPEPTVIGAGLPALLPRPSWPNPRPSAPITPATVVGTLPSLHLDQSPPLTGPINRGSFGRLPPAGDPTAPLGTQLPPSLPQPMLPPLPQPPSSGPQLPPSEGYVAGPQVPRWPPPAHGDVSRLKWWVLSGLVLGVVLVLLVLVVRGSDRPGTPTTPDSVVIVATTPDASVIAPPDAAVIEDAAVVVAADAELDASEAVDASIGPADAVDVPEDAKPRRSKLRTKVDLNTAFRASRYKEIVLACDELGADGEIAMVCMLAACRARARQAQDWYRNVLPKQREFALLKCKQVGHPIKDVCATDLLACRK